MLWLHDAILRDPAGEPRPEFQADKRGDALMILLMQLFHKPNIFTHSLVSGLTFLRRPGIVFSDRLEVKSTWPVLRVVPFRRLLEQCVKIEQLLVGRATGQLLGFTNGYIKIVSQAHDLEMTFFMSRDPIGSKG